jgi:hypothetical protein
VPKTLIQHLIRWLADREEFSKATSAALRAVFATEISPELVPSDGHSPGQRTEEFISLYSLQKLQPLLPDALRLAPEQGRLPVLERLARRRIRHLADQLQGG